MTKLSSILEISRALDISAFASMSAVYLTVIDVRILDAKNTPCAFVLLIGRRKTIKQCSPITQKWPRHVCMALSHMIPKNTSL